MEIKHGGGEADPLPGSTVFDRKVSSGPISVADRAKELQSRPMDLPQERAGQISKEEAERILRQRHGIALVPGIPIAPPGREPEIPVPTVNVEEEHPCGFCPKTFGTLKQLTGHKNAVHSKGGRLPPPVEDAFDDHNFVDREEPPGPPAPVIPVEGEQRAGIPPLPSARKRSKARENRIKKAKK